ncbi:MULTISPECIES: hypothetical protein [unclassified Bradyrhizobium]|uniref:hypothetical protein n=1 Tax=unclassified Bradyrhizobium TaxID=2631580 RepID=UPI0028E59310|nr:MULTISPECIES: hypothetical protein [unclassified Bradyrhizobium]
MDENELLARFGLTPVAEDLPEFRRLIQAETADAARASNEPLLLLCIQLFSAGNASDALLIYDAKMSSFDAGCYIDIQFVCGAGLEATEEFLRSSSAAEAKELLARLQDDKRTGAFDGFMPRQHLAFYRRCYGLAS